VRFPCATRLNATTRTEIRNGYSFFITHALAKHINTENLPLLLEWIESSFKAGFLNYDFTHLAEEIIISVWKHLDNLDILQSLIEIAKAFYKEYREFITDHDKQKRIAKLFDDTRKR